jgi:plastocyanin
MHERNPTRGVAHSAVAGATGSAPSRSPAPPKVPRLDSALADVRGLVRPSDRARRYFGARDVFQRHVRYSIVLTVQLAVLAAAVLPAVAADQTVTACCSDSFTPATVTVTQGDTVTWKSYGGDHNVKFDDGSFEQPADPISSAWTVSRTFTNAGSFRYYCEEHGGPGGAGMSGTVNVQAASGPPSGSPPGTSPSPIPGTGPAPMNVSLRLSDYTPQRGQRTRFYGSVRPQHDGRLVHIQRRTRTGHYRTVARTRLRDAGSSRSTYSRRFRLYRDGIFRAVVRGDGDHATGKSRRRRVNVT